MCFGCFLHNSILGIGGWIMTVYNKLASLKIRNQFIDRSKKSYPESRLNQNSIME